MWNRRFVCTMVTWRTNGRRSTKNICETNCRAKSVFDFGVFVFEKWFCFEFFLSLCIGCKISKRTTFGWGKSGERSRSTSKKSFCYLYFIEYIAIDGCSRCSTRFDATKCRAGRKTTALPMTTLPITTPTMLRTRMAPTNPSRATSITTARCRWQCQPYTPHTALLLAMSTLSLVTLAVMLINTILLKQRMLCVYCML